MDQVSTTSTPISPRWGPTRIGSLLSLSRRWKLEIRESVLEFRRGKQSVRIDLVRLIHVEAKPGSLWSTILILAPEVRIVARGMRRLAAEELVREVRRASCGAKLGTLATPTNPFHVWATRIEQALDRSRWVPLEEVAELWAGRPTDAVIGFDLSALVRELDLHPGLRDGVAPILLRAAPLTRSTLAEEVAAQNEGFLEREAVSLESFFRSVEKSPLSREQIRACVCFDRRVLTIAAAGSGKTSTMVAKAGYALVRGIVKSDEILMLAFNADAAKELSRRVVARLGKLGVAAENMTAATFHKLGLDIIGMATGRKPRVASWLENGQDVDKMAEIIDDLSASDLAFRIKAGLFRLVLSSDLSAFKEDPEPDAWDTSLNRSGFRTLRGETVKSQEERLIADWLFFNGVAYEYERSYEFDTVTPDRGQYRPDFYYPDARVYHEHFALDEAGQPPDWIGPEYLEGVAWKRELHRTRGTNLIETTSFGIRAGNDFDRLQAELESRGVRFTPDVDREIPGRPPPSNLEIARKFRVFLSHAKNNRLSIEDLRGRLSRSRGQMLRIRQAAFLSLHEKIAAEWDRRLRVEEAVDFEDMLNRATDLVARGAWKSPYRLVMVDEFQDVSRSRAELLRALTNGDDRFLFAVGDDWQSINRFAGADISIMSHFKENFGPGRELLLEETFRSPQRLCDVAGDFVQTNRAQIRKKVVSRQPIFGEPVQVHICEESSREALIEKHLQVLHDKVGGPQHPARGDGTVSVLLLGRYNRDMPVRLRQWRDGFQERMRIEFRTIHSSKGLEADYVIVVRMSSGNYAFPSTIEDDPILLLAMPNADEHLFAEERRLFYVALTRARRMVVLYCDARLPSPFVTELQRDGRVVFGGGGKRLCPSCKRGSLARREGPFSAFLGCTRYPLCRFTQPIQDVPASS